MRIALEKSLKERVVNDKKFGVTTDVEKIKKENSQALASLEKNYKEETITEIVRYTVEGDKYRIERTAVSNTEPLEKIRQDALAGQIDLSTPNVLAWNGKVSAEIIVLNSEPATAKRNPPGETGDKIRSSVSYEKIAKTPDFMDYGRDIKDKRIFDQFKKQNLPFSTASATIDGEQGVLLRIGNKDSVTFSIDTGVLPGKGYVIATAQVKTSGAVMVEDSYRDFVKVNDGSWLPTHIMKTNYRINQQGVPYVATKKELLAIDPPKINTKLSNDTFDLANTKEFQSLSPLFRNPATEKSSHEEFSKSNWFVFRLIAILFGIILITLGLVGKWKSFRRDRLGIFFIAVILHLVAACGCQKNDNLSEKSSGYDIILTDSATIINHCGR